MISEFMQLKKSEKAIVITEMVDELAKETELPIDVVIALIAKYKEFSKSQVEQYIKIVDSILLYQVAFYSNKKRVYKNQVDAEVKATLFKKLSGVLLQNPFEVDIVWLRKTIQEFISEEK